MGRGYSNVRSNYSFDRPLLFAVLLLFIIGLLMVATTSIAISEQRFEQPFYYLFHQLIYAGLGIALAVLVLNMRSVLWQKFAILLLLLSFVLLVLVLVPGIGHQVNGSRRWLGLGSIGGQVSEAVKLFFIIYLADYLVRRRDEVMNQSQSFIKPMLLLGVVAALLLQEPDFGATVVLTLTVLGMMFLAGVKLRHFLLLIVLVAILFAVLAVSSPYRLQRLTTFLNPWANQFDSGYQLTQSLIAFGRGGWFGVGLGESIQKLFYLPEAHTDFVFAVLAEEFGMLGVLVVLTLYMIIVTRIFVIARKAQYCKQYFACYLSFGIGLWFALQTLINIGVNIGVLPTKGLTLPLMSYGGSSMIMSCIAMALVLRMDYENNKL